MLALQPGYVPMIPSSRKLLLFSTRRLSKFGVSKISRADLRPAARERGQTLGGSLGEGAARTQC